MAAEPYAAVAGAIINGITGYYGAKKASDAVDKSTNAALNLQEQQYNTARSDLYPWMDAGSAALNEMRKQLGLPPLNEANRPVGGDLTSTLKHVPGTTGKATRYYDPRTGQGYALAQKGANAGQYVKVYDQYPDLIEKPTAQGTTGTTPTTSSGSRYGAFETSPGYLFRADEGQKAVQTTAAARGRAYSGATMREAARYASDLASLEYGNYFNRLASMAGLGQTATGQSNSVGSSYAANAGNLLMNAGATRSSAIQSQANTLGQAFADIGGAAIDWWKNRDKPTSTPAPSGRSWPI